MGRTLRNIVVCSMIAGSLLFTGCGLRDRIQKTVSSVVDQATGKQGSYDKALEFAQNPNSVLTEDTVKEESKSEKTQSLRLENYLLGGDELRFLELSKENVSPYTFMFTGGNIKGVIPFELYEVSFKTNSLNLDPVREEESGNLVRNFYFNSNPVIIKENELNDGKIKDFFNESGIKEFIWAQYDIPKREENSITQNLNLFLFRFGSEKEAKKFLEISKDCRSAPIFLKEDLMSMIYDPTFNFVYRLNFLGEEQKKIYTDLIFDYRKRTGMRLVSLSEDEKEYEPRLNFLNKRKDDYSFIELNN